MAHLIQGFFFQKQRQLRIVHQSEISGGVGTIINEGLYRCMYSGVIFPNPRNEQELIGEMLDCFGESKLFDMKITLNEASFAKKYCNRNDIIHYKFRRESELWVGEYSGSVVGEGVAKCIITEVPDSLFLPPEKF